VHREKSKNSVISALREKNRVSKIEHSLKCFILKGCTRQRLGFFADKTRLRGFLVLFWQATYWHRLPKLIFLRYKAEGLPDKIH